MPANETARFDPATSEPRAIEAWLTSGLTHPQPLGDTDENYSIALPPPNVTGALHMGHALNGAIQDCLVRHQRLLGRRVKWILGTDHAGIATQTQVERQLAGEGTSREALGREAFVDRVWDWRARYGGQIVEQYKRLGATCDYDDERFTLDRGYAEAVGTVFVALYERGLIYRDDYIVNWDPASGSAISDLEVEDREVTDTLYSIAYPLGDGSGEVVVATVRPETMLGDTAVAVNPDDERHRHLIGKEVVLPLVGRRLPIVADAYVSTKLGTGVLKVTPAHDPNDFELGRRHGLEQIQAIDEAGRMTEILPQLAGMTVREAQAAVVAALRAEGLLRDARPYTHAVPFSARSGERIEPLVSRQWFMRMDELARPALEAIRDGRVQIHPPSQARRCVDWLEQIRPWCISRQLWWGHQIPVWYRGDEVHVGLEPPVGEGWERDPDVLDTWFSSALWPFATLGWPQQTDALKAFYPTDVLVTARDIMFLWVARMVMLGLELVGDVPFRHVYVHSVIQAPDGRRMSKSLGTGVDPLDVIEGGPRPPVFADGGAFPAYGADALRFGLLAMSSTQDVRFSEVKLTQGRALVNKLFNASRLVRKVAGERVPADAQPVALEDRWILSRLAAAQGEMDAQLAAFEFAKLALGVYDVVHRELCDVYLELLKHRDEDDAAATAMRALVATLRLAHPVTPFVTEAIWGALPGTVGLLAAPQQRPSLPRDPQAEAAMALVLATSAVVRSWREQVGVPRRALLAARILLDDEAARLVARLAGLELVVDGCPVVTALRAGDVRVEVVEEVVDERRRDVPSDASRARMLAELARAERRLGDVGFVTKAPRELVDAEQAKLDRLRTALTSS